VHEHLCHVGAVRLIFGQIENQLEGAAYAKRVLGHEQGSLAFRDAVRHPPPEGGGLLTCHRRHEADRGPTVHAIHEHVGEPLKGRRIHVV
jgi:hypothetical protein